MCVCVCVYPCFWFSSCWYVTEVFVLALHRTRSRRWVEILRSLCTARANGLMRSTPLHTATSVRPRALLRVVDWGGLVRQGWRAHHTRRPLSLSLGHAEHSPSLSLRYPPPWPFRWTASTCGPTCTARGVRASSCRSPDASLPSLATRWTFTCRTTHPA